MNAATSNRYTQKEHLLKRHDPQTLKRARESRDARFDGVFFVAVKTTGIYCRPICPATIPLEKNVEYHFSAVSASESGFRPCLRCRPDSAPHSSVWLGTETSFQRAIKLINQGCLQSSSVEDLALRLGITSRYLRELFQRYLGVSPKQYAIYQQCLFAKQLLHETALPITDIAYAAGFNSVRRFNEAVKQLLRLTPTDIRKSMHASQKGLALKLPYRPPYDWAHILTFLQVRMIDGLEWVDRGAYCRTVDHNDAIGSISVKNIPEENCLSLHVDLSDYRQLYGVVQRVRMMFDLDAPITQIDSDLQAALKNKLVYRVGLRIPGIWGSFEAGVRAILGQQVTVAQAMSLVTAFIEVLGQSVEVNGQSRKLFPVPSEVIEHDLDFLRMPQARKDTLRGLAAHFLSVEEPDNVDAWLMLKGIGPWTVNYAKIRAVKDPDVWLAGDAGVKNALKKVNAEINPEECAPWRSYLTFQLWNQLLT